MYVWEGHGLQPCRPTSPIALGTSETRALPVFLAMIGLRRFIQVPAWKTGGTDDRQSSKSRSSPFRAGTISRKKSVEKFLANSCARSSGVFSLRNSAI